MATRSDLEDSLIAAWDDEMFQVYVDLLLEAGDPRGRVASLALRATKGDRTGGLAEMIDDARRACASGRGGWEDGDVALERLKPAQARLGWRLGFLHEARVVDDPAALEIVLDAPAARFLRRLQLDRGEAWENEGIFGAPAVLGWADPVLSNRRLPALHRLTLGHLRDAHDLRLNEYSNSMGTSDPPGTPGATITRPSRWIGDIDALLQRVPHLRELQVHGDGIGVATLPSGLEELRLRTRHLGRTTLRTVSAAPLPHLHTLELWLGHWPDSVDAHDWASGTQYFDGPTGVDDLEALLAATNVPGLRHLALTNCAWQAELLPALLDSPLLGQLQTLDVSQSFLDDAGARCVLHRADAVAHLERLDLSHNQIFDVGLQAQLRDIPGPSVVLDGQREHPGPYAAAMRLFAMDPV